MRLFCLPHAGAGAAGFYRWKRAMPPGIDVCPILLPGREVRFGEPSLTHAQELVEQLATAVDPYLDVPFALFGHSMGALLAYAWALRLGDHAPARLFVSGRNAPHQPFDHRDLHLLDDAAFVAELRRRYGGMSEDLLVDPELRAIFLPILRSDLRVVETYRHAADRLLGCPVDAFAGTDDLSVSQTGLAGWGELTHAGFALQRLPGGHFYHVGAGHAELLRVIEERLGTQAL